MCVGCGFLSHFLHSPSNCSCCNANVYSNIQLFLYGWVYSHGVRLKPILSNKLVSKLARYSHEMANDLFSLQLNGIYLFHFTRKRFICDTFLHFPVRFALVVQFMAMSIRVIPTQMYTIQVDSTGHMIDFVSTV